MNVVGRILVFIRPSFCVEISSITTQCEWPTKTELWNRKIGRNWWWFILSFFRTIKKWELHVVHFSVLWIFNFYVGGSGYSASNSISFHSHTTVTEMYRHIFEEKIILCDVRNFPRYCPTKNDVWLQWHKKKMHNAQLSIYINVEFAEPCPGHTRNNIFIF